MMEYKKKSEPLQITEPNARELHTIEFVAGLDAQLINGEKHLEARLRSIPDAWRQYRIALSAVDKVLRGVYNTIPTKTLKHMTNLCTYGEVIVRPRGPVRTDDVQIVPTPELKVLINKVIETECAMCVKSRSEQKGCQLRKALMIIAPPQEVSRDRCNYLEVVAGNELGQYI